MANRQLIVFTAGEQEFGVGINRVDRIIEYQPTRPIPGASSFIDGLINLRDEIIVIIDLEDKLDLETDISNNRILIVDLEELKVGFIVDSASEVLNLAESELKSPPDEMVNGIDSNLIEAIGERDEDEQLIIILALEELVTGGEIEELVNN